MKKMLLRTLKIAGLVFLALLSTMIIVALVKSPKSLHSKPVTLVDGSDYIKINNIALEHLAQSTTIQVIGYDDANNDSINHQTILDFHQWVKNTYPLIAKNAKWEIINQHSLLITLKGQSNKAAAMFLGHFDVVPTPDSSDWKHKPFKGTIAKDTLWGRGALDDKNVIVALLEAAEYRLSKGFQFNRTLIFAFGHDEETGGKNGAAAIAKHLIKNKTAVSFIADEGFGVMKGIVPGLKNNCAIIGLSEKGNVSIKLSVNQLGGHSAWPNPENATSILSRGLSKLENYQFPAHLDGPVRGLFVEAAPYMDWGYRALFSNLWITAPLVKTVLLGGEKTAATIRTTHVTTIIKSGTKENVVPPIAEAIVNLRLFPGDDIAFVESEINRVLNDPRIKASVYLEGQEATPISPDHGDGYDQIKECIHAQFPETVVVPGLVITGTDCKNYTAVTNRMYRFVPFEFSDSNLSGIHGKNEYITRGQFNQAVVFYIDLFQRL
jgi:carboxypeptidase PM20D1